MHNIFHFSNKPPFPLKDGGCVAISSVLKSLLSSDEFSVFHFSLSTYKHSFDTSNYPESWLNRMKMEAHFINTKTDILGAIIHLFKGKSYNVSRFYDKKVAQKIETILAEKSFDIAIFESLYVLPYLEVFKKHNVKVILRAHNVEHKIWQQLGEKSSFFLKKWYYGKLAQQLKKYEEQKLKEVDGIIAISEEDALFFQQFEPKVTTTSIPTAVKTNFPNANYDLDDFYFLGAMDWKPNLEGIDWLLNYVIPDGIKGSTLTIAGKSLKKDEIKHPSVICEGEVKNALTFIQSHGICLIPMRSGSGIKIKLLENMAMGKPIITTVEGVRGVDVEHGIEVLIANDTKSFKEAMYMLQFDKKRRKELGQAGKKFVIDNFGEQKITRRLIAFIKDI
ncbi:MAG: glycosyltransferase family 4 protein [Brumimicrobium sp.]